MTETHRIRKTGGICKLRPRAAMPPRTELKGFSESERETLWRLLNAPLECVYDESFRAAHKSRDDAAGPDAIRGAPANSDRSPALAALTAAEIQELALQFEFCRRQTRLVAGPYGGKVLDGEGARALLRGGCSEVGTKPNSPARALTRAQERAVFLQYNYCRYRMMCVMQRFAGKPLTTDAARRLLHAHQSALRIRNEIARINLGLVPAMVERSRLTGVDFAELIGDGQLALLRSIDKFDCGRGFKFSTYACRAIITSISRSVALMARQRARFPTGYDPAMQKGDVVECRREEVEGSCITELRDIWSENGAELTVIERRILCERFGINKSGGKRGAPKTLRQVARVFGVTKERVRQIQNKALSKLRTALDEQVFAAS